jgi:hypothetical protein
MFGEAVRISGVANLGCVAQAPALPEDKACDDARFEGLADNGPPLFGFGSGLSRHSAPQGVMWRSALCSGLPSVGATP